LSLGVKRSGALEDLVDRLTFGGVSVAGVVAGVGDAFVVTDGEEVSESGMDEAVDGVTGIGEEEGAVDGSTAKRGAAGV
jgi:hypothetical protein